MVPVSASLALLARTATLDISETFAPYLLTIALIAAVYGAAGWNRVTHELDGRPYWILGMAALALAAAVRGQEEASLAWGLASVLSGGVLFLRSTRSFRAPVLPAIGLWAFSALPFSPTWHGARLFTLSPPLLVFAYLMVHVAMLIGYWRLVDNEREPLAVSERWVRLIYPLGIALLPVTFLWMRWWPWPDGGGLRGPLWPGGLTAGLALAFWLSRERFRFVRWGWVGEFSDKVLSLNWLYHLFWKGYRFLGTILAFASAILEGEGGVLWALLLLTLLLSLLAQFQLGG
jgi:hypothetical protein